MRVACQEKEFHTDGGQKMSIWCNRCHYKTVLKRFYDDRCPQCRTEVREGEALTKDPYQPEAGARYGRRGLRTGVAKKKFLFDQKDGSDVEEGSGYLKSKPVDPTFGIEGRI